MKKNVVFYILTLFILFSSGCSAKLLHKSKQNDEIANISREYSLVVKEKKEFSYVEVYQKNKDVIVYVNSDGELDEPNIIRIQTDSALEKDNIEFHWLNWEKQDLQMNEAPTFLKIIIKENNSVIFEDVISLIEKGLKEANDALKQEPKNN